MRIIEEGFYKDAKDVIWYFEGDEYMNISTKVLFRVYDNHASLFLKAGKNLDPNKPDIIEYLNKEEYPEMYL